MIYSEFTLDTSYIHTALIPLLYSYHCAPTLYNFLILK